MKEREKMSVMAFLKVLSCSLIFIVVAAPFIDAQLLEQDIFLMPQQYNIHFTLDVYVNKFIGECNARIYIAHETQDIYFYTENLLITEAIVTNDTQTPKGNEKKVSAHRPKIFNYNTETCLTTLSFPYNLSLGYYILDVKFDGLLGKNGGFKIYKNKQNDGM